MKRNLIQLIFTTIVLLISVIISITCTTTTNAQPLTIQEESNNYILRAEVTDTRIDSSLVTVVCKDCSGQVWEFFTDNNTWHKGDYILLLMDNNNTTTIYDDKVLDVRLDVFSY